MLFSLIIRLSKSLIALSALTTLGLTMNTIMKAHRMAKDANLKTIDKFNNGTIHTIIHEFAHTFVNCYTEGNKLQIPKNLEKEVKKMGYGNPIAYLNDTIVRAITIKLREKIQNIDIQKFFDRENKVGFVYVNSVYQKLVNYETQSLSWQEYFPDLISSITQNYETKNI